MEIVEGIPIPEYTSIAELLQYETIIGSRTDVNPVPNLCYLLHSNTLHRGKVEELLGHPYAMFFIYSGLFGLDPTNTSREILEKLEKIPTCRNQIVEIPPEKEAVPYTPNRNTPLEELLKLVEEQPEILTTDILIYLVRSEIPPRKKASIAIKLLNRENTEKHNKIIDEYLKPKEKVLQIQALQILHQINTNTEVDIKGLIKQKKNLRILYELLVSSDVISQEVFNDLAQDVANLPPENNKLFFEIVAKTLEKKFSISDTLETEIKKRLYQTLNGDLSKITDLANFISALYEYNRNMFDEYWETLLNPRLWGEYIKSRNYEYDIEGLMNVYGLVFYENPNYFEEMLLLFPKNQRTHVFSHFAIYANIQGNKEKSKVDSLKQKLLAFDYSPFDIPVMNYLMPYIESENTQKAQNLLKATQEIAQDIKIRLFPLLNIPPYYLGGSLADTEFVRNKHINNVLHNLFFQTNTQHIDVADTINGPTPTALLSENQSDFMLFNVKVWIVAILDFDPVFGRELIEANISQLEEFQATSKQYLLENSFSMHDMTRSLVRKLEPLEKFVVLRTKLIRTFPNQEEDIDKILRNLITDNIHNIYNIPPIIEQYLQNISELFSYYYLKDFRTQEGIPLPVSKQEYKM